jgi:DNA polymerase-3 subunit delta'
VLEIPSQLTSVGACFAAAERLVTAAKDEAAAVSEALDDDEMTALRTSLGDVGGRGSQRPRGAAGAIAELERRQRSRATRTQRDSLDRALVDLAAFYRDVLVSQLGAPVEFINPDLGATIGDLAAISPPEATLRRIEAVLAAREAIDANVAPLLAVEAMTVSLNNA